MDALRNARLMRFSSGTGGSDSVPANAPAALGSAPPDNGFPAQAQAPCPAAPANGLVSPAIALDSFEVFSNLVGSMKEILEGLPAAIANALAPHLDALPGAVANALAPHLDALPGAVANALAPHLDALPGAIANSCGPHLEGLSTAAKHAPAPVASKPTIFAPAASQALVPSNTFAANSNGSEDKNTCGVCHMPGDSQSVVWAFISCGHYPFCSACIDELKKKKQCDFCPFCTQIGKVIALNFDD